MTYIPEESKVIYQSKDGRQEKVFEVFEWFAACVANKNILGFSQALDTELSIAYSSLTKKEVANRRSFIEMIESGGNDVAVK